MAKYNREPFSVKTKGDLSTPSKDQFAITYDALSEGPIEGLADGLSSIFINDVPVIQQKADNILKPRRFDVTNTTAATITHAQFGEIDALEYQNKTGLDIGTRFVIIEKAGATGGTGIASTTAGEKTVTTSSSFFTDAMTANRARPVYLRIAGAGKDGTEFVTKVQSKASATSVTVKDIVPTTVSNADISFDHFSKISSISGNVATLETAPLLAQTGTSCQVTSPQLAVNLSSLYNYDNIGISFRTGNKIQTPAVLNDAFGQASVVVSPNTEIRQADLRDAIDTTGNLSSETYNDDELDEVDAGLEGGTADDTVYTDSFLNVSNPSEVDEIHLMVELPQCHATKASSGAVAPSYVELQIFFEFSNNNGTDFTSVLMYGPTNNEVLTRTGPKSGKNVNFIIDGVDNIPNDGYIKPSEAQYTSFIEEFVINTQQFQPYDNFRLRIRRINAVNFKDASFQHKNPCRITTIESIIKDKLSYPYTSYGALQFNAKDFNNSLPVRSYLLKGRKVKVPTNYRTREETGGAAAYTRNVSSGATESTYQNWDGNFRGDKSLSATSPNYGEVYTDNPVWIFYDLLTNDRYGLGQFISEDQIDKYELFRLARYCDEEVSDGKGGTEPRFTCNVYLTKTAEATQVIKQFASIFRGMALWRDGQISAIADRPQEPIYTFTKANVKDGLFTYEGTGERIKTNQVKVTWNDPNDNYRQSVEYVEDHDALADLTSPRIIREDLLAFGTTSRAQAHRLGKWKLLSAQNELETVSFNTGLNAAGLRPGDVIAVQDADRDRGSYSGRVSNTGTKNTTTIPLDRSVTLPSNSFSSGFPPQLLLIYPSGGAYLDQDSATISSTTYSRGDLITSITSSTAASNQKDDSNNKVNIFWSENVRVEVQTIHSSTGTGSVSSIVAASAFSAAPDAEVMWALKIFNADGTEATGSVKEYKVVSVKENTEDSTHEIVGTAYFRNKYDIMERGFVIPPEPTATTPDPEAEVPAPANLQAKIIANEDTDEFGIGTHDVLITWDFPLNSDGKRYEFAQGFEVRHSFKGKKGLPEFVDVQQQSLRVQNVKADEYNVSVRTVSNIKTYSLFVDRTFNFVVTHFTPPVSKNKDKKIAKGGLISAPLGINSSTGALTFGDGSVTHFNFQGADGTEYLAQSASSVTTTVSGSGGDSSGLSTIVMRKSGNNLVASDIRTFTDSNSEPTFEYFGANGSSDGLQSSGGGTITVEENSNKIVGSGTSFTSALTVGEFIKIENGSSTTQATGATAANTTTITLSGSNSNIKIGQTVTGGTALKGLLISGSDYSDPGEVYVVNISGTTLTVNTPVSIANGTTLTFTPRPVYRFVNRIESNTLAFLDEIVERKYSAATFRRQLFVPQPTDTIVATAKRVNVLGTNSFSLLFNFTDFPVANNSLTIDRISPNTIVTESEGIGSNDNDTTLPTSAAVKDYVDTQITAEDLDIAGDTGTGAVDLDSQSLTIAGTTNEIETSASGQTITVGLPDDVTISGDLQVDTDTLVVDATNDRVGIGTTSPTHGLTLVGSADSDASSYISVNDPNNAALSRVLLGVGGDGDGQITLKEDGNSTTVFINSEGSSYFNGGNVGIGTTAPDHILETSTAMGTSPTNIIFLRQTGTNQNGGGGAIRFDTSASNDDHTLYYASVEGIRSASSNGSNELHFKTTKTGVNSNAPTTQMIIDEDGNVGIGTTSPSYPLDVNGTAHIQGDIRISSIFPRIYLADSNNNSDFSIINANGNFGIYDDTNSAYRLQIDSSGNANFYQNVTVTGNLTVQGTTTTLETATLDVEDKNITLNYGAGDTSGSADGAGITIQDAVDASTDATLLWNATNDEFDFSHTITLPDTGVLKIGNSDDIQLSHSGIHSYFRNYTGNLYFANYSDDKDIVFESDDGSGGLAEYIRIDGSITETTFSKTTKVIDNFYLGAGTSTDLYMMHDGTNSHIINNTGDLTIRNNSDDKNIYLRTDDGLGGTVNYVQVDGNAVLTKFLKDTKHLDSVKATFGDSADLQIYHTGSASVIRDTGAGSLYIDGASEVFIRGVTSFTNMIKAVDGGQVELYHNNLEKLATTSTGIDVTGDVTASADINAVDINLSGSIQNTVVPAEASVKINENGYADGTTYFRDLDIYDGKGNDYVKFDGSTQRVGIGTSSPSQTLDVQGNIILGSGGASDYNRLQFVRAGGADVGAIGWHSDDKFYVAGHPSFGPLAGNDVRVYGFGSDIFIGDNNNGDVITVQYSSGNVGISNTTPDDKLSISGGDVSIYGSTSSGLVTHRTLHFHTSDGAASLSNSNKQVIGEIAFSGHDSSVNADGKYAHIKSYVIDANSQIQGTADEGGQLEFTILRHDVSTEARVEYTALTIDNSANVGIGTTSPSKKLHVENGSSGFTGSYNSRTAAIFEGSASNGTTISIMAPSSGYSGIFFGDATQEYSGQIQYDHPTNAMKFLVNAGEKMRISTAGNVGIGTDSPNQRLVVVDNSGETTVAIDNATTTTGNHARLDFRHNGITGSQIKSENIEDFTTTANRTSDLQFYTRNNGTIAEAMRITEAGNIGVGLTSPQTNLHLHSSSNTQITFTDSATGTGSADGFRVGWNGIYGQMYLFENADMRFATNNAVRMTIKNDGNVGIGDTSPAYALEVNEASNYAGIHIRGSNAPSLTFGRGTNSTQEWKVGLSGTNGANFAISTGTTNTDRLIIDASGNAGINAQPSSSYKLDVGGSVRFSGSASLVGTLQSYSGAFNVKNIAQDQDLNLQVNDGGTNTTALTVQGTTANVGIGTTSPSELLHVVGNIKTTGNLVFDDGQITSDGTNFIFDGASGKEVIISSARDVRIIIDDNNDDTNNEFQIFKHSSGSASNKILNLTQAGALTINEAYTFPTADGSANQVLQTDGSGNLSFVDGGTVTALANMVDNRVLTASGSTTINGEANLLFGATPNELEIRGSVGTLGYVPTIVLTDTDHTDTYAEINQGDGTLNVIARNNTANGAIKFAGNNGTTTTTYGGFDASGNFEMGTTDVIEAGTRNLVNIGTITSGFISASTNSSTDIALSIGSSSSTQYTLQRWITSAHSGNTAYMIAYGASHSTQANHFAMKNLKSGGEIFFELFGVEPLRLTSTGATFVGNVGIGTTSPSSSLHVHSTNYTAATFERNQALSNYGVSIDLKNSEDNIFNLACEGTEDFSIGYTPSGGSKTNLFTLNSSGNLGIGTTSPSEKLHINDSTARIRLQDSDGTNQFLILQQDGTNSVIRSRNGTSNGVILFQGNNGTSNTTYGIFNAAGNLGIGTGSPLARMHVVQDSAGVNTVARFENTSQATSLVQFQDTSTSTKPRVGSVGDNLILDTANTERVRIDSSGNVGIGTTSPQTGLQVAHDWVSDYGSINISSGQNVLGGLGLRANNVYKGGLIYRDGTAGAYWELTAYGNEPLLFKTNNAERMRITNAGRVGIGTTPSSATNVHIQGSNSAVFRVDAQDGGSAPATTAIIQIYGYEGRGAGLKIRDSATSASGASNREWFIGSGYNQSGFNIGYASDGSQSSYSGQNKLAISTSGAVTFNGAYTFPTADGSANQVLTTDGSGNLSFADGQAITINNNAAGRVIFGSNTANTLEADSEITRLLGGIRISDAPGSGSFPHIQLTDSTGTNQYANIRHDSGVTTIQSQNGATTRGSIKFYGGLATIAGFDADGNFEMGTTDVIDASRNLVNIADATINGEVGIGTTPSSTWKTIIQSQYPLQLKSNTGAATYEFYAQESGTKEFRILNSAKVVGYNQNLQLDTNSANTHVRLATNGSTKLATTSTGVTVTGLLSATTKSFVIDHPTKEGMKLRYGSLEGPENGVYVRGRLKGNIIELPEYWTELVHEDSITVNLTPIGKHQKLYVEDIKDNQVIVGNENLLGKEINCFYTVYAERKDVERFEVEYNE